MANRAEDDRNEEKSRDRGQEEATDHGSSERSVLLPAFTETERHRDHADDHGESGHQDRAQSRVTGENGGVERGPAFAQLIVCERDHQDAVRGRDTDAHDRAHHRFDVESRVGEKEHPQNAGKRTGERGDDDEWISPGLEIDHHQEIDEERGKDEAESEFVERGVHAFHLTAHSNSAAGCEFWTDLVHNLCDLIRDAAKIRALHIGINIEDRLDIGVIHHRRCLAPTKRDDVARAVADAPDLFRQERSR